MMKIFVSLAVMCLALHSGMGLPARGKYMFLKCNPSENNANCQTHKSPEMVLSAELPAKLPASATPYIGAEPVAEMWDDQVPEQEQVKKTMFLPEEGSGVFEGSADAVAEGSGYWTEAETPQAGGAKDAVADYQPAEGELREDHLMHL